MSSYISDSLFCYSISWQVFHFGIEQIVPHLLSISLGWLQQLNCNNTVLSQWTLIIMIMNDYEKRPECDQFTYAAWTSANILWHLMNACLSRSVFPLRNWPFPSFYFFFVFSCQQCWLITLILIHSSVNTFSCWGLWYIPGTLCMRWECSLNGKPVNRKTSCTQSLISRGNLAQPIHLPACFWEVGRNWSVWRNPHRYSRTGKTPHKQ